MSDWDNIGKGQTFTFAKNERKIQALAEGKDNADYYPDSVSYTHLTLPTKA